MGTWRDHQSQIMAEQPIDAVIDPALLDTIDALGADLPDSMKTLRDTLAAHSTTTAFGPARALAARWLRKNLNALLSGTYSAHHRQLMDIVRDHLTAAQAAPFLRHALKNPSDSMRRRAATIMRKRLPPEVALPLTKDGDWGSEGWTRGTNPGRLFNHKTGQRRQKHHGVAVIGTVGELRTVLGIASAEQLGFFLTATGGDGPYTRFSIPKRDGSARQICAPRRQLKTVQRKILSEILAKIPPHDAAHGFVPGRSTATNAARHVGKAVIIKFDLRDFFTTVHYARVMGLFAHLGYDVDELSFNTRDDSRAVAPTLARLTTYTNDPSTFFHGWLPQGAPTSPAITNLICRGLDARLSGLATKLGGHYTRYADDLTFSFGALPDSGLGRFRWWVDQICQQEGFSVRQDKFRAVRRSQRQTVTGIVVNDTMRIPRKERRRFRAILHNCRTKGIASQARGRDTFPDWLRGMASYIHMVHPQEGKALLAEVDALLNSSKGHAP